MCERESVCVRVLGGGGVVGRGETWRGGCWVWGWICRPLTLPRTLLAHTHTHTLLALTHPHSRDEMALCLHGGDAEDGCDVFQVKENTHTHARTHTHTHTHTHT